MAKRPVYSGVSTRLNAKARPALIQAFKSYAVVPYQIVKIGGGTGAFKIKMTGVSSFY
ncbi:hypothetical protein [Tepidicaulis sp.]|jgi:hypothetical protein|uniref:hypothetical protein n=1 Tax=Tepidicaulis sp. TaxID=1920809 RepID=UPI003B5C2C3F